MPGHVQHRANRFVEKLMTRSGGAPVPTTPKETVALRSRLVHRRKKVLKMRRGL